MRYDVLVTRDRGLTWRRHAGLEADGPPEAVRRLVLGYPDLYKDGDEKLRFHVSETEGFEMRNVAGEIVSRGDAGEAVNRILIDRCEQ